MVQAVVIIKNMDAVVLTGAAKKKKGRILDDGHGLAGGSEGGGMAFVTVYHLTEATGLLSEGRMEGLVLWDLLFFFLLLHLVL